MMRANKKLDLLQYPNDNKIFDSEMGELTDDSNTQDFSTSKYNYLDRLKPSSISIQLKITILILNLLFSLRNSSLSPF